MRKEVKFLRYLFLSVLFSGMIGKLFATSPGPCMGVQLGWGRVNQGEFIAKQVDKLINKVLPDTTANQS